MPFRDRMDAGRRLAVRLRHLRDENVVVLGPGRPAPPGAEGRTALVVDDGIATGSTARAACQVARAQGAARVVLAAPVCSPDTARALRDEVDEVFFLETPRWFSAVGQCYIDFRPTSDGEVVALLQQVARRLPAAAAAGDDPPYEGADPVADEEVEVTAGQARLAGHLVVPADARGLVVHGSGSSRHSPRNRCVAEVLQRARSATLLFDLLTPAEELDRGNVFDIGLLSGRLAAVTSWVRNRRECRGLPVGYFGARTGAAAALAREWFVDHLGRPAVEQRSGARRTGSVG